MARSGPTFVKKLLNFSDISAGSSDMTPPMLISFIIFLEFFY